LSAATRRRAVSRIAASAVRALVAVGSPARRGEPAANGTAYIEFQVEDIDADYERLKDKVQLVHELKMMPWGNKTFQFRDPEGTAVSLYIPATDEAKNRFASRFARSGKLS